MRDINTRFDAPHSRYNEITRQQLEDKGLTVLIESADAGVHLAVSPDGIRTVYFQGHPEYDSISLLKEYKREVFRYCRGERDSAPRYPEQYFSAEAHQIVSRFMTQMKTASDVESELENFPEAELKHHVDNTWGDTGKAIVNNWLGLVYKLTNMDRKLQFMPGVDPANPLQSGARQ
jgi:homoserine O-succinyltransferase